MYYFAPVLHKDKKYFLSKKTEQTIFISNHSSPSTKPKISFPRKVAKQTIQSI